MKTLGLFAGQGAQFAGMGCDLVSDPDIASLFGRASGVLGYDIASLCFNGPIEKLTESNHCQPAIFTVSAAAYAAFSKRCPVFRFDGFAGLSLGEWTALWASGVLEFEDAVRILEARGRFMQEACSRVKSGMLSVMSLSVEAVGEIAEKCGLSVSNINSQNQINIAGEAEKLSEAQSLVKAAGGKSVLLNVAGAFHSPYMQSARESLAPVLASAKFSKPAATVFSNATGLPHPDDPEKIKALMLEQLTGTVNWLGCIINSGAKNFVEFGPGKVLSGLAKRIDRESVSASICDNASIEAFSAARG